MIEVILFLVFGLLWMALFYGVGICLYQFCTDSYMGLGNTTITKAVRKYRRLLLIPFSSIVLLVILLMWGIWTLCYEGVMYLWNGDESDL